jgi:hypothetical protein
MLLGICYTLYDRINRTIQRPETKEKEGEGEREKSIRECGIVVELWGKYGRH